LSNGTNEDESERKKVQIEFLSETVKRRSVNPPYLLDSINGK
jgi:hypothetical protein